MTTQSHCRTRETYTYFVYWWGRLGDGEEGPYVTLIAAAPDACDAIAQAWNRPRPPVVTSREDVRAVHVPPTEAERRSELLRFPAWLPYADWLATSDSKSAAVREEPERQERAG